MMTSVNFLIGAEMSNDVLGLYNPFIIVSDIPDLAMLKTGQLIVIQKPIFNEHFCDESPATCHITKCDSYSNRTMVHLPDGLSMWQIESKNELSDSQNSTTYAPIAVSETDESFCSTRFDFEPPLSTCPPCTLEWDTERYYAKHLLSLTNMQLDSWLMIQTAKGEKTNGDRR